MAGWFELGKSSNDQYRFVLKAGSRGVILTSGLYTTKGAAEKGITSVHTNGPLGERYERKTASNGKPHFDLKAAGHRIIGNSQLYMNEQSRETGTTSVKTNNVSQTVKDKT